MNERSNRGYTVGELAKRFGVSVRTLQYYDKEGILSPQRYTEGGRRLYGNEELFALHQILFLKSFGFSLDEIRDRLLKADSPAQVSRIFRQQKQALEEQVERLREVAGLLSALSEEMENMGYLNAEKLGLLMELMKERSPYTFMMRYFGKKEMDIIKGISLGEEDRFADEWQELFSELLALYQSGADAQGPEGQALAEKWWAKVREFTQGDAEVMTTLIDMGDDVDNWPEQAGEVKQAAKAFLSKALGKYLVSNGIMPERGMRNE